MPLFRFRHFATCRRPYIRRLPTPLRCRCRFRHHLRFDAALRFMLYDMLPLHYCRYADYCLRHCLAAAMLIITYMLMPYVIILYYFSFSRLFRHYLRYAERIAVLHTCARLLLFFIIIASLRYYAAFRFDIRHYRLRHFFTLAMLILMLFASPFILITLRQLTLIISMLRAFSPTPLRQCCILPLFLMPLR